MLSLHLKHASLTFERIENTNTFLFPSSPHLIEGLQFFRKNTIVRWERPSELQAGAAGTHVLGHARSNHMGAVAAYKPTVFVGDHQTEFDARHAIWAADDHGFVAGHRRSGHKEMHAERQTTRAVTLRNPQSADWKLPRIRQMCRPAGRFLWGWQQFGE
jgi:hypothetical protein